MSDVGQIQVISMPRLNEAAPDFEAETTHGRRRLSDYHGKWLVLFSLFSDFTPVCTAELSAFAEAQGAFSRLNTELLGLSAATTADHHAWLWKIRQHSEVEVSFPLIEDPSLEVAYAYGIVHHGVSATSTAPATFVIDPVGFLRAMACYPRRVGRQIAQIARLVRALQVSDANNVFVPEDWHPCTRAVDGTVPLCYRPLRRAVARAAWPGNGFRNGR